eukprot:2410217-Amphidinium_carterae.1
MTPADVDWGAHVSLNLVRDWNHLKSLRDPGPLSSREGTSNWSAEVYVRHLADKLEESQRDTTYSCIGERCDGGNLEGNAENYYACSALQANVRWPAFMTPDTAHGDGWDIVCYMLHLQKWEGAFRTPGHADQNRRSTMQTTHDNTGRVREPLNQDSMSERKGVDTASNRFAQSKCNDGDTVRSLKFLSFNTRSLSGTEEETKDSNPSYGLNHPGLLVKLLDELSERQVDIAAIQESRLRMDQERIESRGYTVIMSPAQEGRGSHGGLIVALKAGGDVKVVSHRSFGSRVLAVDCSIGRHHIKVVSMHGPVRKSPASIHEEFADQVQMLMESRKSHQSVLVGADLNCKLGSLETPLNIIGEHTSPCPHQAKQAHRLIHSLHRHQMFFLNTLLDPVQTDHVTWKHPRSTLASPRYFQIDFVMASEALYKCCAVAPPLPWGSMDSLLEADHRPIEARFVIQSGRTAKTRRPLKACLNKEHESRFRTLLRRRLNERSAPINSSAAERIQDVLRLASETLQDTRPSHATPRKDWISGPTWTEMRQMARIRKSIASWRQSKRSGLALILSIKLEVGDDDALHGINDYDSEAQLNGALRQFMKQKVKKIRYALRHDKKRFVDQKCKEAAEHMTESRAKEAFDAIKKLVAKPDVGGGSMLRIGKEVVHDKQIVGKASWQHWKNHFDAIETTTAGFENVEVPITRQIANELSHQPPFFQLEEIDHAFKKMHKFRASPDLLHF